MIRFRSAFVLVGVLGCTSLAHGQAVVSGFDSSTLPANDDGYTGITPIGFSANFFGVTYTDLFVNNNGNVTFLYGLSDYTPTPIVSLGIPMIAPYWADVDTRGSGSGIVSYGPGTFEGHTAFGVNWPEVGYFSSKVDKLNTFQLLLVDRSDINPGDFDMVFNYNRVQWETGDASDGSGGLGGFSARAGYTNGGVSYELPGSAINGALLDGGPNSLSANSNVSIAGRWVFEVRNGAAIPEAGSLALCSLALVLGGAAWRSRRHRDRSP